MDITNDVVEQLASVRESALVNMMDRRGVREVANALGHEQLVEFCDALDAMPRRDRGSLWVGALKRMGEDE